MSSGRSQESRLHVPAGAFNLLAFHTVMELASQTVMELRYGVLRAG